MKTSQLKINFTVVRDYIFMLTGSKQRNVYCGSKSSIVAAALVQRLWLQKKYLVYFCYTSVWS